MANNNFKALRSAQREAIPQFDPEASPPPPVRPLETSVSSPQAKALVTSAPPDPVPQSEVTPQVRITQVDTSEPPANRGFFMYPSRHRQIAKDLAYIEDRRPWLIVEDALEEYVVRHYGKQHKRDGAPRQ